MVVGERCAGSIAETTIIPYCFLLMGPVYVNASMWAFVFLFQTIYGIYFSVFLCRFLCVGGNWLTDLYPLLNSIMEGVKYC